MKRIFYLIIACSLAGCSFFMHKTSPISERNRENLENLLPGMTQEQVLYIMGFPTKSEEKIYENEVYDIWYYFTHPSISREYKKDYKGYTPLIFKKNRLLGWGRNFYDSVFYIHLQEEEKEEKEKSLEEAIEKIYGKAPPEKEKEEKDELKEPPKDQNGKIEETEAPKQIQETEEEMLPKKDQEEIKIEEKDSKIDPRCKLQHEEDNGYNLWE